MQNTIILSSNVAAAKQQRVQQQSSNAQNTVRAQAAATQNVQATQQAAATQNVQATQQAAATQSSSNTKRATRLFNVVGHSTRAGTQRVRCTTTQRAHAYAAILSEEGDCNIALYALSSMCTKAQAKQQLAVLLANNATALVTVA
jgi:hypothetical protein